MRTCVIFNPVARGEKARHFRARLDAIAAHSVLKGTVAPGDGRRLAAEAVREGFDTLVAAGGDGTLNEVLNGIGDVEGGFDRARLGVVPLGTVNVFARELGLPLRAEAAWDVVCRGRETRIDLPCVEYSSNGASRQRHFAQLAGAGLDARAIELVNWPLKRKIGALAYVLAGLKALLAEPSKINVTANGRGVEGELVLIGNGRLYGGGFGVFPDADLRDGRLDVCVLPRANWLTLARCGPALLVRRTLPAKVVRRIRVESFTLESLTRTAFELDGELVGLLPASFSVKRGGLRVLAP